MSDALAIPDKVSSAQGKWCQPFFLDNFQVERIILAQTEVGGDMKSHTVLIILGVSLFLSETGVAQEMQVSGKLKDASSCNEFAVASKPMMGKSVGFEECRIISEETVFNIKGHKFRRVEMRITGTVDGWASTEKGPRAIYFTDGPDFVFTQSGL